MKAERVEHAARMVGMRNVHNILVRTSEGKRPFGRPRSKAYVKV